MEALDFLEEVRFRLQNPAVSDPALLSYINMAMRDVSPAQYVESDYIAQILDTTCLYLCRDNKFPEVQSVSGGGVTTSFSSNDPMRYRDAVAGRRQGAWVC
jgi:hypothetical protein